MSSVHHHRALGPEHCAVFVCTVSDTRTAETDKSGPLARDLLLEAGHRVVGHAIVRDEVDEVRAVLTSSLSQDDVDAIVLTGGTGISPRDITSDVVVALPGFRLLPGFGELFRMLSFPEIGAAAMMSRALAGGCQGKLIVALPGSRPAVRLALTRLLLPELSHLVGTLRPAPARG